MKINSKTALVIPISLVVTSCYWQSYEIPSNYSIASNLSGCPKVGVQNLDENQAATILSAVGATCEIVHTDEFASRLNGRMLRPRCNTEERVRGEDVVAYLRNSLPGYSVMVRKPRNAEAVTNVWNPNNKVDYRVGITPSRVRAWDDPATAHRLIDTTAHEWTHLITDNKGLMIYLDDGHSPNPQSKCPDNELVSYVTGYAARDAYIAITQSTTD